MHKKRQKSCLQPIKLVITVPTQVKQEPQLLHIHPVHGKTLNIVENTTHKHNIRKTRPTCDQYIQSYKWENTGDQTNWKTALHRKITSHTTTTTTSQKDRKIFENSNILLAFKGLNAITLQNQRNQSYQL